MNDERSFERFVADHVAGSKGGIPMPEDFYDDMNTFASTSRQRPEWLALIKEPPMRSNSRLAVGSPTVRVAAIMVATLHLAMLVAGAGIAGSRLLAVDGTIVVAQDGSGDYSTITEAVAMAEDGDEILVKSGTYPESIVIDKDITLLGEDRDSVIIELSVGCSFDEETCPDGTPTVVREWETGYSEAWPFGIHLDHTTAEIGNLSIHDHALNKGITAHGGGPVIHDVKLTTSVPEFGGGNVMIWGGSTASIHRSELGGVELAELSPAWITGSIIFEVNANLTNTGSNGGEAIIRDNVLGWMSIAGPVTVEGNEFPESMASDDGPIGVFVERGGGWVISDNVIRGRQTGIQALPDGVLEGNIIEENGVGLYHVGDPPSMSGDRICDNSIRNVRADRSNAEIDRTKNEICPDDQA